MELKIAELVLGRRSRWSDAVRLIDDNEAFFQRLMLIENLSGPRSAKCRHPSNHFLGSLKISRRVSLRESLQSQCYDCGSIFMLR